MPDRKSLVTTLWLTFAIGMMASVSVASSCPSVIAPVSSRPDTLRQGFALPWQPPTTFLGAATAGDAVPEMNALPSEDEEQDSAGPADEPRVCSLLPCYFRKVSVRQRNDARSTLSLYPLRC